MDDRLYLRQLRAGRDFGTNNPAAQQMANFVYLIGDRVTHECLVVDPAWDVDGILAVAKTDDMRVVGALVTHYHPDHIGGSLFGRMEVPGLKRLLEIGPCPIHVHEKEAHGVKVVSGVSDGDLVKHASGDVIKAGDVEVELLHTPGHTPGSSCFRCRQALIAGDTLFLQGCGRVDLPGGDPEEMRRTLQTRLMALPDDLVLYPGHEYGGKSAPLGDVKRDNPAMGGRRPRA
jgi:hydroxyacylglutathione hydrolase